MCFTRRGLHKLSLLSIRHHILDLQVNAVDFIAATLWKKSFQIKEASPKFMKLTLLVGNFPFYFILLVWEFPVAYSDVTTSPLSNRHQLNHFKSLFLIQRSFYCNIFMFFPHCVWMWCSSYVKKFDSLSPDTFEEYN